MAEEIEIPMRRLGKQRQQPTAAMFISLAMLERLELDVEDIESGEITSTDLLESCLIPEAARITGVWKGTMRKDALPVPDQITLVGAQSRRMCVSTEVDDGLLRHRGKVREKDFDELCAEMEDTEDDNVSLADVVGKLSPNLLIAFGMEEEAQESKLKGSPGDAEPRAHATSAAEGSVAPPGAVRSPFSALSNATIVWLPATLIDMDGKNARNNFTSDESSPSWQTYSIRVSGCDFATYMHLQCTAHPAAAQMPLGPRGGYIEVLRYLRESLLIHTSASAPT